MPVNTKHSGYKVATQKAQKVRDFAKGAYAVKGKGDAYLPRLGGQTKDEYEAYKTRGYLVPAVEPTALAMIGSIMRKPPTLTTTMTHTKSNIDGNNSDIKKFTSTLIKEVLYAGGVGYLVEWDEDQKIPVAKIYKKENLINYSDDYYVLTQTYNVKNEKDHFEQDTLTEYLELTYDEEGFYIQNLWREVRGKFAIVDTVTPTNRGEKLTQIPFVFSSVGQVGVSESDPVLLNLADVNQDQYLMSTDQRHGLHWTALPTMFLFGDLKDEEGQSQTIKVGAGSSNHINDESARVELLEFTGAGLGSLESAINKTLDTMASIGAKMLTGNAGGVKAAETARIDASAETATLSILANTADLCINEILKIMDMWSGSSGSVYAINRDFIDTKLDPNALMALLKAYQSEAMSLDTFLYNIERGELLPDGVDREMEAERIEAGRPFQDFEGVDSE